MMPEGSSGVLADGHLRNNNTGARSRAGSHKVSIQGFEKKLSKHDKSKALAKFLEIE